MATGGRDESLSITLRQVPFFAELPREELARIAGKLDQQAFAAGQVIFSQGMPGDALYVVQSGAVEVVLEDGETPVQSLAVLGPSDCFGEMALLTGHARSATVRALVDAVVLRLGRETWEGLLAQHPSITIHFCRVLSQRLGDKNWDISKGRGALHRILEEAFAAQPVPVQDFLIRTSVLQTLDVEAVPVLVSIPDPEAVLRSLGATRPAWVRPARNGSWEYPDYVQEFLAARRDQALARGERLALHIRCAGFFSARSEWVPAIHHFLRGEAWTEAVRELEAHRGSLLDGASPEQVLRWLDALQPHASDGSGHLVRLRTEALVRLGYLDAAIRSYQEVVAKGLAAGGGLEAAGSYQELARLHQRKGETGEALACLRQGLDMLAAGRDSIAVQAMQSVGQVQQGRGTQEGAIRWAERALHVAHMLATHVGPGILPRRRQWAALLVACAVGGILWHLPPPAPMDVRGMHLLASLIAGVIVWAANVFDEFVVAILLLFVWIVSAIVPPEMAAGGFASSAWFFFLGALGIGAAVTKSGLLYRVALQVLRRLAPVYRLYTAILAAAGLVATPVMPNIGGRLAIMAPVSHAIAEAMGFAPLSNGTAGLVFSAYVGFSQVPFLFLTGSTGSLFGWNLLPEPARATFGWGTWAVAALPAGLLVLATLWGAIHLLFPLTQRERAGIPRHALDAQLEILGPLTRQEWISLAVLGVALVGWVGRPLHGIAEAWVTLGAFLAFLLTGVLDRQGLRSGIDWGFLLFFGVISSLAVMVPHLKVDRWLIDLLGPALSRVASRPLPFLISALLLAYAVRLFLNKFPTLILLSLALMPWAQALGIHPGVLLLTLLMALECWFFPYQDTNYQILYYSTHEKAFTHAQGRRLMAAKLAVSLVAVALSVPYWRLLGLIR